MAASPLSFSIPLCFHTDQEHISSPLPWHLWCIEAIDGYFVHDKEYVAAHVIDKNKSIVQLEPHTQPSAAVWVKRVSYLFIVTPIMICLFKLAIRYLLYGTFYIQDKASKEMQSIEPIPPLSVHIYTPPELVSDREDQTQKTIQALKEAERKITFEQTIFKEAMLAATPYSHVFTEKEIQERALIHRKKIEHAYLSLDNNGDVLSSDDGISVLCNEESYIFTLRDIPDLIFKIDKKSQQTVARYNSSQKAAEIVKTHKLHRMIIPRCVLFTDWEIPSIIVEEMIPAKPREEQSDLWEFASMDKDLRPILQTYIDELLIFVEEGGSKDVSPKNYLLIGNGAGIACVDNEEVVGPRHPVRSLLRNCLFHEEQFDFAKRLYKKLGLLEKYEEDLKFAKQRYNYGLIT